MHVHQVLVIGICIYDILYRDLLLNELVLNEWLDNHISYQVNDSKQLLDTGLKNAPVTSFAQSKEPPQRINLQPSEVARLDVLWAASTFDHTPSTKPGLPHPSTCSDLYHCVQHAKSYAPLRQIQCLLLASCSDRYKREVSSGAPSPEDEFGTGRNTTFRQRLASGSELDRSGCTLRRPTRKLALSHGNTRDLHTRLRRCAL